MKLKPFAVLVSALLLPAILLIGLAVASPTAQAQRPVSDDEVNAVAKKMYCPICENTPLDVCPTQACKDWRALIRQQLGEGWSEAEIQDYFVANYGPRSAGPSLRQRGIEPRRVSNHAARPFVMTHL